MMLVKVVAVRRNSFVLQLRVRKRTEFAVNWALDNMPILEWSSERR
jgi:hypothetical protein